MWEILTIRVDIETPNIRTSVYHDPIAELTH